MIRTLALAALLGVVAAGCGATNKTGATRGTNSLASKIASGYAGTITVAGSATTTIASVRTGTRIRCKGWPGRGVRVPAPGTTANVGEGKVTPYGARTSHGVQLTHLENGSLTVFCSSR